VNTYPAMVTPPSQVEPVRASDGDGKRTARVLVESPVLVFETGLPTRYYLHRTRVNFEHLIPTGTVTACPYKGIPSGYWSIQTGETVHRDLAWAYDFPTRQLLPIAGLIAFDHEKVDIIVDGQQLERPRTHFSGPTGREGA
jgi:uncharacterized protein (DUF427 family)